MLCVCVCVCVACRMCSLLHGTSSESVLCACSGRGADPGSAGDFVVRPPPPTARAYPGTSAPVPVREARRGRGIFYIDLYLYSYISVLVMFIGEILCYTCVLSLDDRDHC